MGTRQHAERQSIEAENRLHGYVARWIDRLAMDAWVEGARDFRESRKRNPHTAGTLKACYWRDGWDHSWREVEYGW